MIELDQVNPKRAPSASYDLYEICKTATTVGEAKRLGATTGHVRYDVKKGYARLAVEPAIVVFGAAAAPLVETWCDKENPLGTVGDVMGPKVSRFTAEDDLSDSATIQRALQTTRSNPGSHLHGSLPCTPWTSWQRLNLHRSSPATKARIARIREQSLKRLKTFTWLGKAKLAGGGSVSFEWPRLGDGWRQEKIRSASSSSSRSRSMAVLLASSTRRAHRSSNLGASWSATFTWLQPSAASNAVKSLEPQLRGGREGRADGVLPSALLRSHPQGPLRSRYGSGALLTLPLRWTGVLSARSLHSGNHKNNKQIKQQLPSSNVWAECAAKFEQAVRSDCLGLGLTHAGPHGTR